MQFRDPDGADSFLSHLKHREDNMSKRPKYTVYDERVAKRLGKISQETYSSVQDALRRYPDVHWRSMLSMALHLAATIATNAAQGKKLSRKWVSKVRA